MAARSEADATLKEAKQCLEIEHATEHDVTPRAMIWRLKSEVEPQSSSGPPEPEVTPAAITGR